MDPEPGQKPGSHSGSLPSSFSLTLDSVKATSVPSDLYCLRLASALILFYTLNFSPYLLTGVTKSKDNLTLKVLGFK